VRDILNTLSYSEKGIVASTIESLDYIQKRLQQRNHTEDPSAHEPKQKVRVPRSPKASAKQPARKNPVQARRIPRPKRRKKR
jgi:hypothetical protein